MSDLGGNVAGCLVVLLYIGTSILSIYLAWIWVEPDDFGSALLFLFISGLFTGIVPKVIMFLGVGIVGILSQIFKGN